MTPLPGLEHHRTRAGLSRRNLAQRAGLVYSTVWRIEHGAVTRPQSYTVGSLAGVLGVTGEELAQEVEPEPEEPLWARWRAQVARLEGLLANEGGQR